MNKAKIRDLIDYLYEKHCGIDSFYADYINGGISDKIDDSDGKLNEDNILDGDLDEYYTEIREFVFSCLENEYGNMFYDVYAMVKKRDNK